MKISVVTICYNAASTIGDTLASVAAQDWPDVEHIVVDGASTDATMSMVERYARPRLRALSEPDHGLYDAMNKGLARATGDYVGFLNADDYFARRDSLRLIAERALRGGDCIIGDTQFFDPQGHNGLNRRYSGRGFAPWWLKIGLMPPHPSFYAKRSLLLESGGFDTRFRIAADFDLLARLFLKHGASWSSIGKVITCFRTGGVSTSGRSSRASINSELAQSLASLGYSQPKLRIYLRYPMKVAQYRAWRPRQEDLGRGRFWEAEA